MAASTMSLLKEAERVVDARLDQAGYERKRRGEYVFEIGSEEGILGWLGISPLPRQERELIEALPYVGVYDPEVERVVAYLRGERRRFSGRTVGAPLGEVPGGRAREPYVLAHDGEVDEAAIDRMLAEVDRYGRPFVTANADREELRRTIEKSGEQHDVMFRLPVVLLVLGQPKAAKRAVARAKREFRSVTKAARAYGKPEFDYDEFARRFEEHLESTEAARP